MSRHQNREYDLKYAKEYREKYPERVKLSTQKWRDKNKERIREYRKNYNKIYFEKYRERLNERRRDLELENRYGITREEHKQRYVNQNGCCDMCKQPTPYEKINTDHHHDTNRTRGLICHRCNLVLGFMESQPESIKLGIEYLEKYGYDYTLFYR